MESAFDKRKLVYWGHSKDILNLSISDYKLQPIFHATHFYSSLRSQAQNIINEPWRQFPCKGTDPYFSGTKKNEISSL